MAAIAGPLLFGLVAIGSFAANDPSVQVGSLGLYLLRAAGVILPLSFVFGGIGGLLSSYAILLVQEFVRPVSFLEAVAITTVAFAGFAGFIELIPVGDLEPTPLPFWLGCALVAAVASAIVGGLCMALRIVVLAER